MRSLTSVRRVRALVATGLGVAACTSPSPPASTMDAALDVSTLAPTDAPDAGFRDQATAAPMDVRDAATTSDVPGVDVRGADAGPPVDASVAPDAVRAPDVAPADVSPVADAGPMDRPATAVWTNRNDNLRSAATLDETQLTVASVSSSRFGLLFTRTVVGQIYAQPLFVPALALPGHGTHDTVFVATEHNAVYAFDATDAAAAAPFWSVNLGPPVPSDDVADLVPCPNLTPEIGITATPVIDLRTSTLYVLAKSKEAGQYVQRLHALDLGTGLERFGGPVVITASIAGTGAGSVGGRVAFDPLRANGRPGLLLSGGTVYLAFASHCDREPYHGWILGYDAATLAQSVVYNDTTNGANGGIWQSGMGLSADDTGDVYFASGNGTFDPLAASPQLGDSAVRLHRTGATLAVVDWFTPFNQSTMNDNDDDFGSTGVILVPRTNLGLVGSKTGHIYLFERDRMGRFHAGDDTQIRQSFLATANEDYSNIHGAPVFWDAPAGTTAYVWGQSDYLKAYRFDGTRFVTTPTSTSTIIAGAGMPGGMLALSANGSVAGTGVVWASIPVDADAEPMSVPGVLRAFDASNVHAELWNSERDPRDAYGAFAKFVVPTIAGGRVYMATFSDRLNVYGLR